MPRAITLEGPAPLNPSHECCESAGFRQDTLPRGGSCAISMRALLCAIMRCLPHMLLNHMIACGHGSNERKAHPPVPERPGTSPWTVTQIRDFLDGTVYHVHDLAFDSDKVLWYIDLSNYTRFSDEVVGTLGY